MHQMHYQCLCFPLYQPFSPFLYKEGLQPFFRPCRVNWFLPFERNFIKKFMGHHYSVSSKISISFFEHRTASQSLYDEFSTLHDCSVLHFSFKFKYWLGSSYWPECYSSYFTVSPLISETFKLLELKVNVEIIYPYNCNQNSFKF